MANRLEKYSDNIQGPYFVDMDCIACDNCYYLAPNNFSLTLDFDHAYVMKQPINPQEQEQCLEALKACPVDSIGYQKQ
ncbi:ferredoxin [Candidatus Marinamargulisbacteria bacterium SCGC AAA071-K20]|nr:ferredoxin [Candidatus Marinamargulisbacteria bacterium SCGC AAA071-K20]